MNKYKGYFTSLKGTRYRVEIANNASIGDFIEIPMAYEEPFVVSYDGGNDMFIPMRISTASMTFISESYMDDIFPSKPTETTVKLYDDDTDEVVWQGYLKANVYDSDFQNENERVTLEASDGIAALQYINYKDANGGSGIWETAGMHSAYAIMKNILSGVGINYLYVQACKKDKSGNYVYPDSILLSEKNFYSSDNNEPWKSDEVLSEICKYMGFTAIQIKDSVYLYDYSEFKTSSTATFLKYTFATDAKVGRNINIYGSAELSEDYMADGASISFLPVYNKAYVRDSLYTIDDILPSIFSDEPEDITYRLGGEGDIFRATTPADARQYVNKRDGIENEKKDNLSTYLTKMLDMKGWESVYSTYSNDGAEFIEAPAIASSIRNSESVLTGYIGGTVLERAQVKASKRYYDVEGAPSFERGLFMNCSGRTFESAEFGYDRYALGDVWKEYVTGGCSYTIPEMQMKMYPPMYRTYGQYNLSAPIGADDVYLVLDVSAMYERYPAPYINNEWSSTGAGYRGGFSDTTEYIYRYTPCLVFSFQCGDKWYNGYKWVNTKCAFRVPLSHSTEEQDDGSIRSTGDDWNVDMSAYNNIQWENWSSEKGYKISLEGLTDRSGRMDFTVRMPCSIVGFWRYNSMSGTYTRDYTYNWSKYPIHGSVWLTNLTLKAAKNNTFGEKDVVYENIINESHINELDEEEFKITTNVEGGKPSYSTAMWSDGSYCDGWKQSSTGNELLNAEEQWIAKNVSQYSTPTRVISLTLGNDILPMARLTEGYTGKEYAATSTEIDFATDAQTLTMVELN